MTKKIQVTRNSTVLKLQVPKNMKPDDEVTIDEDGRVRVRAANDECSGVCLGIDNGIGTIALHPSPELREALNGIGQP